MLKNLQIYIVTLIAIIFKLFLILILFDKSIK